MHRAISSKFNFLFINIEREKVIVINTICPKIIRPTRSAGGLENEKDDLQ